MSNEARIRSMTFLLVSENNFSWLMSSSGEFVQVDIGERLFVIDVAVALRPPFPRYFVLHNGRVLILSEPMLNFHVDEDYLRTMPI